MKLPSLYFPWLQKDNPTGTVDRFPELKGRFETSVPGVYCVGDLTGVPLIKLAAESGYDLVEHLAGDPQFTRDRESNTDENILDLVIIGAGPAGVSACLHAAELGMTHVVLESSQVFNTIVNFPAGKPIYVTPVDPPMRSGLAFTDGTKESLLEELRSDVEGKPLPVHEGEMVQRIIRENKHFTVESSKAKYRALRVVVAIGKSGNPRQLGVPGEKLPKVYTRLIDPALHTNEDILVVGGGDSALEAAAALSRTGNRVTLSYRRASFSRPKEHNVDAVDQEVKSGRLTVIMESTVTEIREDTVLLQTPDGAKEPQNQAVYALIGAEIPIAFFQRSDIRMEGEKRTTDWVKMAALLLFASVLYFGKKSPVTGIESLGDFFTIPLRLFGMPWHAATNGLLAWASFIGMVGAGMYLTAHMATHPRAYFGSVWNTTKHLYYAGSFLLFGCIYLSHNLAGHKLLGYDPGGWYTAMYSLTIVVFGLRRIHVHPTGYIKRQTYLLMAIQVIPLFVLPVFVFPVMGRNGLLGDWVMRELFPGASYWRAYGFILAWPLFIHNLATGQPTVGWLLVGLAQTFVIIPWLNYRWGKGAYCGWICSCGALAETLGDEYRTKAPHGPAAKKADNIGQVVLWFAGLMTILVALGAWGGPTVPGSDTLKKVYELVVDIVFAGVLGVGVYFFLSGRVWCRFFCPLAALMHIYTRFSVYRIFSNKKRCISCNICTKVCHMGIDVMGYANRGIPMNDVQCVRCSACVVSCPMQVLTFGETPQVDLDNTSYKEHPVPLKHGWASGLPREDIEMLVDEETKSQSVKEPVSQ